MIYVIQLLLVSIMSLALGYIIGRMYRDRGKWCF